MALCQMIRPGAPCVMGGFTSNVDMRTGSPAFGTPEFVNASLADRPDRPPAEAPVRSSARQRLPNASTRRPPRRPASRSGRRSWATPT